MTDDVTDNLNEVNEELKNKFGIELSPEQREKMFRTLNPDPDPDPKQPTESEYELVPGVLSTTNLTIDLETNPDLGSGELLFSSPYDQNITFSGGGSITVTPSINIEVDNPEVVSQEVDNLEETPNLSAIEKLQSEMNKSLDLESIINIADEKITSLRDELVALKKRELQAVFNKFFESNPDIYLVHWTQYLPVFNDGDPCYFTIGEVYVWRGTKEEYEDFEFTPEVGEYLSSQTKEGSDVQKLRVFLRDVGLDDLFDEYAHIIVTRDNDVIVNEYDPY